MGSIIIIGAGIVGLATAKMLLDKEPSLKIVIIEKETSVALHQTGNNSGVIHSGIYYKPGSAKAVNCRKGYSLLLEYLKDKKIKYELTGKIIVATEEKEIEILDDLYIRGVENGLDKLEILDENEINKLEPKIRGLKGIYVPYTGIVDFKEVSLNYKNDIISSGGKFYFNEKVCNIIKHKNEVEVLTSKNKYHADFVVTCCGLYSDEIASITNAVDFRIIPFRGEYYKLKSKLNNYTKHLIYPVPDPKFPFLGVHLTNKLDGSIEAGPNAVFAFKKEGYKKSDFSFYDFYKSISWKGFRYIALKYWNVGLKEFYKSYNKSAFVKDLNRMAPNLLESDLVKGGAGIRAQACSLNGKLLDDFHFLESEKVFHVCNAPSPAATSSLAIGEHIASKVLEKIN